MASETEVNEDITTFYKSLNKDLRTVDEDIIYLSTAQGIVPSNVRYTVAKNIYRGGLETVNNETYFFIYVPNESFKLVKADTQEKLNDVGRFLSHAKCGFLLKKSENKEEEDPVEDEEKAMSGGHGGGSGGPKNMGDSDAQLTALTPDRPDVGRDWHGDNFARSIHKDSIDLLKSAQSIIQEVLHSNTSKEQEYMISVLGFPRAEVLSKGIVLHPTQRLNYISWLNKSTRSSTEKLNDWLKKNG